MLLLVGGALILGVEHVFEETIPVLPLPPQSCQVCFTPSTSCLKMIQTHLDQAQESILVQAFSFTDPDIAASIINAKKRGVSVRVLLDKSNVKDVHSKRPLMVQADIPVAIDSCSGIAHNKVIILDGKTLITGSYNFVRRESRTTTCSEHYAAEPTVPSVVF
jgi:phosphatidylserine/phosphatidylglycerophosphate/cardiolipin synthase-like enzyme